MRGEEAELPGEDDSGGSEPAESTLDVVLVLAASEGDPRCDECTLRTDTVGGR